MDKFAIPKGNIILIIIGLGVMILGYILMAGGGSKDPEVFSYAIFSFRRMVLAPIIILLGFGIEIFAIMNKKPLKELFNKSEKK